MYYPMYIIPGSSWRSGALITALVLEQVLCHDAETDGDHDEGSERCAQSHHGPCLWPDFNKSLKLESTD